MVSHTTRAHLSRPRPLARAAAADARRRHWYWLAAGLGLFFLIPFVLTDVFALGRDLYYGIYVLCVFSFVGAWVGCANERPVVLLTRNWRAGAVVGLIGAAAMAGIALSEPATDRPGSLVLMAAILWRGIVYGLADGLILSAFPILAVFAAFAGTRFLARRTGRVAVGALALAVSLLFTLVYHAGYSDFRGEKVRKPLAGDLVWSLPTLATLSPLGAPLAHAGLHVGAVVHSYETDVFLPPHEPGLESEPFDRVLSDLVAGPRAAAPGAAAYVSTREGSWSGAAGLANVDDGTAMAPDARMRLESIGKVYTATVIHQLAAEGKLRVDDTLETWLPGVFPYGAQVTLRDLLTHRSGIVDDNELGRRFFHYVALIEDAELRAQLLELRRRVLADPATEFSPDILVRVAAALPPLFRPGTEYRYSNTGFLILGMVASRATGTNLPTLFRERIFDPLGLDRTAWDPQGAIADPHAHAYRETAGGKLIDVTDWHSGKGADGGIVSTAQETARFFQALMRGEVLAPRQLAAMKAHAFWSGGDQTGCAGFAFGHGGAGAGFRTHAWVSGDGGRVAVLLLNGRKNALTDERTEDAFADLYCATVE